MLRRLRPLAGTTLSGLLIISACSFKDPNEDKGPAEPTTKAGDGGRSGSSPLEPSSANKAGRGGNNQTHSEGGDAITATDGGAGGAGDAPACPGCDSGFCVDGACVECVPSNDHCPTGQFCTDANQCVSGCKTDGSSCASGVCNDAHDCSSCISDAECADGRVCGNGRCGPACAETENGQRSSCDDGLTCCSLHCTNLEFDSQHCGACGASCDSGDFCGIDSCPNTGEGGAGGAAPAPCVTCHPTTLANLCAIATAIVILDTNKNNTDGNRVPGRAIGAALAAQCTPTPKLMEAEQDGVAALNLVTGRPVAGGGELLIVAGGPFFQNLEGYVEKQRIAPLYWQVSASNDHSEFRRSSDDSLVVALPIAGDHDSHDFFIVQFMRDSASGSLALNAQGFWQSGTVAAAFQVTDGMLPALSTFDKAWYAYEWTDMNGDKKPDLNEISLIDSE